jgi:hypothetical protein
MWNGNSGEIIQLLECDWPLAVGSKLPAIHQYSRESTPIHHLVGSNVALGTVRCCLRFKFLSVAVRNEYLFPQSIYTCTEKLKRDNLAPLIALS